MKIEISLYKVSILFLSLSILTSCSVTIPLQSNLNDQTLLHAENRNIKANYTLVSNVPDGTIPFVAVMKNGSESENSTPHKYASETAFKNIWKSYFTNKFNNYADDEMDIVVTLKDIKLKQLNSTSIGESLFTGNVKMNVDAFALIHVIIDYNGKKYENDFEVLSSEYNESQMSRIGNTTFTRRQSNPTQQKAKLLEGCLNRSVIQFENFLRSIMMTENDK